MNKVLIFGNSASGKSTLALNLASQYKLSHLDLDTLASVSRSKCESLYWLARFNASVDFPLAELPKISTLFIIFNLVISQAMND